MADRDAGRFIGTAIGPVLWGTTYGVFVGTLPTDHPILISALRALPAGLLMLLLVRRLPPLRILFPVTVLALTNIGLFFALLLISAARLPGGITATLAACQPLLVALLTWPLLGRRPGMDQIGLALLGMVGVGLLVLKGGLAFDLIGLAFGLQLGVAGQLADAFLDLAADVLGGAFDTVVVRHGELPVFRIAGTGGPSGKQPFFSSEVPKRRPRRDDRATSAQRPSCAPRAAG